ncbi:hypothetical protein ACFQVA_32025 [Actinomadura keratinilytica]
MLGPAPFAGDGADGALAAASNWPSAPTAATPPGPAAGRPRAGARRRHRAGARDPHPALEVGRQGCFAVPLRAAVRDAPDGALAALLARNEATVPALGAGLNLAGRSS